MKSHKGNQELALADLGCSLGQIHPFTLHPCRWANHPHRVVKRFIETKVPPGTPDAVMAQRGNGREEGKIWKQYQDNISIDSLKKHAVLGTSHIVRKVLQSETLSLSGGVHHGLSMRSTREKITCDKRRTKKENNNNNNNNKNNDDDDDNTQYKIVLCWTIICL
jgi:hypothetical protein